MEDITFGELEQLVTERREELEREQMYFTYIEISDKCYSVHDNSNYSNSTTVTIFINEIAIEFNYYSTLIFVRISRKIPDSPDEILVRNTLSKLKDRKLGNYISKTIFTKSARN